MYQSFFDDKDEWTQSALKFDNEIRAAVEPIIKKWMNDNYSPRELSYIAYSTVNVIVSSLLLHKKFSAKNNKEGKDE